MTTAWDSPALRGVPGDSQAVAEEVAARLGLISPAVVDVARLHLEALDSALRLEAPQLLTDQLRWQSVRLQAAGAGFMPDDLDRAVREELAIHLDGDGAAQVRALHEAASALGEAGAVADAADELPPGPARDYLEAALGGHRDAAVKVVRDAMATGAEVSTIMLEILQPAQLELGRLWENGQISIAHEHYTTAITQLCLSLLYPRLLVNRTLLGRNLVATTVGSEAHEVGIRMISDLFEEAGWRTAYLGADVAHQEVVDRIAQHRADVLAVSATMTGHLRSVRQLIEAVRADPRSAHVKVLVGGRPFALHSGLADLVGADGWAAGAREALALCHAWSEEQVAAG